MLTRSDIPKLLRAGLQEVFDSAFATIEPQWSRVAMRVDSNKDQEDYAWLGATPRMREFVDERLLRSLREDSFTIRNRTWESTISVDRAAVEDEQYGQIKLRVSQMAEEASRHLDELVFATLAGGFTAVAYDGAPFFSDSHQTGDSGLQSNIGADPLSTAALKTALTQMRRLKDDQGKPIGVSPNLLVVLPELEFTAWEILNSSFYPDPLPPASASQKLAANPLKGSLGLLVTPYLDSATNWFLLDTTRSVRPLAAQVRTAAEFTALEQDSEAGFMRDEYLYGVRARHAAGYGLWQYAFGAFV